jgi:hypothetical protein
VPRDGGPARFQFSATWTVEVGHPRDLELIAPGKMRVLIQHGAGRLLEQAGAAGRVGAVTCTCQPTVEYQPEVASDA